MSILDIAMSIKVRNQHQQESAHIKNQEIYITKSKELILGHIDKLFRELPERIANNMDIDGNFKLIYGFKFPECEQFSHLYESYKDNHFIDINESYKIFRDYCSKIIDDRLVDPMYNEIAHSYTKLSEFIQKVDMEFVITNKNPIQCINNKKHIVTIKW